MSLLNNKASPPGFIRSMNASRFRTYRSEGSFWYRMPRRYITPQLKRAAHERELPFLSGVVLPQRCKTKLKRAPLYIDNLELLAVKDS